MISVDTLIDQRLPRIANGSPRIRKPITALLRSLFHEEEFKQFERDYPYLRGIDFVEKVLEYFDFSYVVSELEKERIPVTGKIVIIANHPIGSLDGLALLKLVGDVRPDVKVVANELLYQLEPLRELLLPVDNMGGNTPKQNLRNIEHYLNAGGAVIIFPSGEVSRAGPRGVRDSRWRNGFMHFAEKTASPVLPVHVNARNSIFFYALSLLAKPLSTLMLIHEMFKQANQTVRIKIGPPVPYSAFHDLPLTTAARVRLFRKHVYKIGKRRSSGEACLLPQVQAIAHPEPRQQLRSEIRACERLGVTRDGMEIYNYRYEGASSVMRELGRLREISFRAVGEGSGKRRDIDAYDGYYDHVILWDDNALELVGAYRLAPASTLAGRSLYTQTLFDYKASAEPYLQQGVELGRSFIQPTYQGMNALDYLWQGVGAYLGKHKELRYLFGPVSISNTMPSRVRELMVHFYSHYFPPAQRFAVAKNPVLLQSENPFAGNDYKADFRRLKTAASDMGCSMPPLYKQYSELTEEGGVCFVDFNTDPDFADCIDGLVMVDLYKMKANKAQRYLS